MNKGRFEDSARSLKPADHQWHARGQGFKSPQLHHPKTPVVQGSSLVWGSIETSLDPRGEGPSVAGASWCYWSGGPIFSQVLVLRS